MSQQEIIIAELRERITRLEAAAKPRPRCNFNLQQAAEHENMSVAKFRTEVKAGRVSGKKIGRVWHFSAADLAAYEARPTDE